MQLLLDKVGKNNYMSDLYLLKVDEVIKANLDTLCAHFVIDTKYIMFKSNWQKNPKWLRWVG